MAWDRLDRISELVNGFDHAGAELEFRLLDDLVTGHLSWLDTVAAKPPPCYNDRIGDWREAMGRFARALPPLRAAVREDDPPAGVRAMVQAGKPLEDVVSAWSAVEVAGSTCV